jgi:tetratricopeptide (TPR) repeat protein
VAQAIDDQNPVTFLFLKGQAEPPPLYPELYADFQAAQAALAKGDGESASAAARKILERRPLFLPARLLLIHIAEAENRFVDALLEYQELVERIPPVAALHLQVARLAYRLKAFELAECHALRALETELADAAVYSLLANARLSAGKAEKALQSCRDAIAAGFATAAIYFTLGEVHHARMEIGLSLAAFQKALAMDPEAAENIAAFALSSLTTEQYASLRQLLEAHVESHPENINTLYSLGVMYSRDGETEKSKAYFNRVRELAPQQAQAYYNLALIYQREGETALAREAMTRFNQLKAEDDQRFLEGRALHDERLKGREALSGREFARAVAIFTALAGKPSAEVQDFIDLGQSLLGAGRAAEARSAFEKARQRAPHDSAALLGLSRSLELLGEKRAAERYRAAADLLTRPCP